MLIGSKTLKWKIKRELSEREGQKWINRINQVIQRTYLSQRWALYGPAMHLCRSMPVQHSHHVEIHYQSTFSSLHFWQSLTTVEAFSYNATDLVFPDMPCIYHYTAKDRHNDSK